MMHSVRNTLVAFGLVLGISCTPGGEPARGGDGAGGRTGGGGARSGGASGQGGGPAVTGGSGGSGGGAAGPSVGSGGSGMSSGAGMSGSSRSGGAGGSSPVADASAGMPPEPGPPPAAPADDALPPCKRTMNVSGELGGAIAAAMPGDCLIVADGQYGAPTVSARGTAQAPILIRAANRLKAVFSSGTLTFSGAAHVVFDGFAMTGSGGVRINDSSHCRISRFKLTLGAGTWIELGGNSDGNRIDRSELGPKNADGNLIGSGGLSTNTRIDRNYFHDVSPGGGNGRETLRLGCCGPMFDYHDKNIVVEHNLFVNCSGEAEIITVKSSSNVIRYNTFRGSRGNVTLRAGRKSAIYGNFMFGNGIRLYEDDHKVFNNYVQDSPGPGIIVGSGQPPSNAQVRRAFIVHNTVIGSGVLFGHGRRPLGDLDTTFANNIIRTGGTAINFATPSVNPKYHGNIVFGGAVGVDGGPDAFRVVDPQLQPAGAAMGIPASSPAVNAATMTFPFVTDDVNGQPRDKPDIGADEWSEAPGARRPLTTADVGPDAP